MRKEHFLGLGVGSRDPSEIFSFNARNNLVRDYISGTAFSQAYTPTNRNRITSAGLMAAVPANTPVIDHIGASLDPALRLEPAAANILLGAPPVTQDLTLGIGSFTLQVFGAGTATPSAGTATITGEAAASNGVPNTFAVTVAGTVTITIATATVVWLCPGAIPSSYFAPAAAIGAELVTDGGFAAVTEGAELSSGLLTIGNCYKITARTDGDFIAAGSPDNTVGTYFNATTTGAGLLDAGDKVKPITFTSWTVGAGWAPQATAGSLTGKAQHINTGAYDSISCVGILTVNKIYCVNFDVTIISGGIQNYSYGADQSFITTSSTVYQYFISGGTNLSFRSSSTGVFTLDNVSIKEHGTVRLSEANTTTLAIPAKISTMLAAGIGTIVIKGRFAFARAAGVVANILASASATNSLVYTTTAAGNITSNDGTTIAENTGAYTANTDWKIALKFPSDTDKYRIGIDVAGAGIVWGTEVAFDGAFTATANLILGYVLHGATWIKYIKIYDKVLTDAQINAL